MKLSQRVKRQLIWQIRDNPEARAWLRQEFARVRDQRERDAFALAAMKRQYRCDGK